RISDLEDLAAAALARIEESWGVDATGETGPHAGTGPDAPVLAAAWRLAEIPGITVTLAIAIISEIGLDMTRFPTAAHLVSWIGLCRTADQSGPRQGKGTQKNGNSYARCYAGQAATGASGTHTFLGERHRRIARRRGKAIAQTAVPRARYRDLGEDHYSNRTSKDKKIRNHIRQLEALGVTVTITADNQAA